MKKLILFLVLLCYQASVYAIPEVNSPYIYFYQLDREEVLYEQGAENEIAIASLTKIMTASVALDLIENLEDTITLTPEDFKGLKEAHASMAGFFVGEVVTYRDLLYGLILPSGADAALALSNHLVGSEEAFVVKMNEKADLLKLHHTIFKNTTGLDVEGQHSSLEDVSIILRDALKNPDFQEIFTTSKYITSNKKHTFRSTLAKTSSKYNIDVSYIKGSKTGYTPEAGLCLASIAEYDGRMYLLITANADYTKNIPYQVLDSDQLYRYFFENYEYKIVQEEGQLLKTVLDEKGNEHNLLADENIVLYLPKDSKISYEYEGMDTIHYGKKIGDVIGHYSITVDGKLIHTQTFYLDTNISKSTKLFFLPLLMIPLIVVVVVKRRKKKKI